MGLVDHLLILTWLICLNDGVSIRLHGSPTQAHAWHPQADLVYQPVIAGSLWKEHSVKASNQV
eukprot:CAMPEP_0203919572 /NCGR_PEP_ID=MMETSP0359-20131031/59959_1 /ASSEMBLY_ACC=CAM_ASM_000338 /TAXON_ID=268821 /ORGANISM="Scrippsiella Hangoei, Strain SHTV-5" /LENGTH=62 /DNA_ID=CAMNT_0050846889 /DNA_START=33 /DNA_END=217 /DNA_ORIENTATION=+